MSEFLYKTISGRNFMLIPCTETGKNIETQIKMLTSGGMERILPVTPTSKNGVTILQYDITGLTRLSGIIQHGKLSREQFPSFIEGLLSVMEECSSYALSECGVSLDNDCIYFDTKSNVVKFVFVPTLQSCDMAEKSKEMLRSFIAYGKVELNLFTASVTDVINSPTFGFVALKEVWLKNRSGIRPIEWQQNPVESQSQIVKQYQNSEFISRQTASQQQISIDFRAADAPLPVTVPQTPTAPIVPGPTEPTSSEAREKVNGHVKGIPRNTIIIIAAAVISLGLIIGGCFTPIVRAPDGGFDIVKVFGLVILVASLDFLLLRNKLQPKTVGNGDSINKGIPRNTIIIIATAVISLILIIGGCFTPIVRAPDGGFDIIKVFGLVILVGSLDFLLLRGKLQPQAADADSANVKVKAVKKKAKEKTGNTQSAANFTPISGQPPFMPPVYQPQQQPIANKPPQHPNKPDRQPAFVQSSVPTSPMAYSTVQESGNGETVVLDEPAIIGGLYLQTAGGESIHLNKSPFLIGRDKTVSDYTLNNATIGRKHAEFYRQGDDWVIVDQNSRNHSYLNGICIDPYTQYRISEGDTIRLADVTLRVKDR